MQDRLSPHLALIPVKQKQYLFSDRANNLLSQAKVKIAT